MSANLSTYVSNAVFTLFGSIEKRGFNEKKSVFSNFNSMCSLSCFKRDSEATLKLKKIIAENDFTYDEKLNDPDHTTYSGREREIGIYRKKLANVQIAINNWRSERALTSTRFGLIRAFEQGLDKLRKNLENYVDCTMDNKM